MVQYDVSCWKKQLNLLEPTSWVSKQVSMKGKPDIVAIRVTRLGYFWNALVTNFHAKVTQILTYFWAILKNNTFKIITAMFWVTFGENWDASYSIIWSHWFLLRCLYHIFVVQTSYNDNSISNRKIRKLNFAAKTFKFCLQGNLIILFWSRQTRELKG